MHWRLTLAARRLSSRSNFPRSRGRWRPDRDPGRRLGDLGSRSGCLDPRDRGVVVVSVGGGTEFSYGWGCAKVLEVVVAGVEADVAGVEPDMADFGVACVARGTEAVVAGWTLVWLQIPRLVSVAFF